MDVVVLDHPAPGIARIRIDRPAKRNAIDADVRAGLVRHLSGVGADAHVRALVLGGSGGTFSAGGDLPTMRGLDADGARARMRDAHAVCRLVAGLRIPVVSAVEGACAGAAIGLALLGDAIVVAPSTRILFPFLQLGLTPDWGQVLTLPRRVGHAAALRLFTSGRPLDGAEAIATGLADAIADDAMAAAIERAAALAALPADAFARTKSRLAVDLDAELAREEDDQAACMTSQDFRDRLDAALARRA